MSEARNRTRVKRGLRLPVSLIFITAIGLVLSLSSPEATREWGYPCGTSMSNELAKVGWPIPWLELIWHKENCTAPSRVTGLAGIDPLGLLINEVIYLAGIGLATWPYTWLRRARIRTVSGGQEP